MGNLTAQLEQRALLSQGLQLGMQFLHIRVVLFFPVAILVCGRRSTVDGESGLLAALMAIATPQPVAGQISGIYWSRRFQFQG